MNTETPAIKRKKKLPILKAMVGEEMATINLKDYVMNPANETVSFHAETEDGDALPEGLKLTKSGLLHGIPKSGTDREESYKLLFIAESPSTDSLVLTGTLTIAPQDPDKARAKPSESGYTVRDFWKAFLEGEYLDLAEVLTRKISPLDIYYLLSRFATLTVWNADDLSPAGMGKMIQLNNASPDFLVFDFGVALVATPKDLYDHKRTVKQALQTAHAMADACHKRGWNIEMAGFDKMVSAAWVRVQEINEALPKNKQMKVMHYEPSAADKNVIVNQRRLEERLKA